MSNNHSANPLDQPRVITGAIAVFSAGALVFNVLPLLLGVTADALALTPQQLGILGSAYMAAFALAAVPSVSLLQRVSWRAIGLGAGLMAVTTLLAATRLQAFAGFVVLFLVVGVAESLLFALGNRVLGATSDPDRAYGLGFWVGLGIAAGLIFLFAQVIIPTWGFVGVYVTAAVVVSILVVGCFQLPGSTMDTVPDSPSEQAKLTPAIALGLLAIAVYYVGLAGLWTFVERIGVSRGIAADTIGTIVAVCLVATAFGSLAPIATEGRFSRGMMLLLGSLVTLAAMLLLALPGATRSFLVGVLLFNFVWGTATVYIAAIIAVADSSGHFLPLIGGAMGIGATFGPALAGMLIHDNDFTSVFILCGTAVLLSATLAIVAERLASAEQ